MTTATGNESRLPARTASADGPSSLSHKTREDTWTRLSRHGEYDLLVIGGGITGAAVARDAASRGLSVALVEANDYASGTSSRSSKLIHGGLRYLENMEFGLVFEALAERAYLLKTAPTLVRPLPFYLPVYEGDRNPMWLLGAGLWLYDLLALFRTPWFHSRYSPKALLADFPALNGQGLKGGFRYSDASMWDDVMVVETLRSAAAMGVDAVNYARATEPIWEGQAGVGNLLGFRVQDSEGKLPEFSVRAKKVVVCAGPWTDQVGHTVTREWRDWLTPSKGIHLLFDLKRLPVPGALVMSSGEGDGRISFVIPRPDFGAGVTIVGTTDGPSPKDPGTAAVDGEEVRYLMKLLNRYFPSLNLTADDILSAYVGVRPLFGNIAGQGDAKSLQKVSREHHIGEGPGGSVVVAGGKYTTHRTMAREIVDFALKHSPELSKLARASNTKHPLNLRTTTAETNAAIQVAKEAGWTIAPELFEVYGGEALEIHRLSLEKPRKGPPDPEGFPALEAQLRWAMRNRAIQRLEDFYFRRTVLYSSRRDHGLPWAPALAEIWAEERGLDHAAAVAEHGRLETAVRELEAWRKSV